MKSDVNKERTWMLISVMSSAHPLTELSLTCSIIIVDVII